MRIRVICLLTAAIVIGVLHAADDAPRSAEPGTLIVIDQAGKEHKLKAWKFTAGTRHLSWLAPAAPAAKDDKSKDKVKEKAVKVPAGPEALEFRDEHSTTFAKGILTLVPLERIRSVDFDNDQKSVTLRVAVSARPEEDVKLTGTTKYKGENHLTIEAEVDKGDMGVAEIKFLAGVPKGIKALRFPPPKVAEAPMGRSAVLTASDKEKTVHTAVDVQVLYHLTDGTLQVLPMLMFKKTLKVDLAKVKKLHFHSGNAKEGPETDVAFTDGEEQTVTLLRAIILHDKAAALEGLLARVPVGYKLFPIHTLLDVHFGDAEKK